MLPLQGGSNESATLLVGNRTLCVLHNPSYIANGVRTTLFIPRTASLYFYLRDKIPECTLITQMIYRIKQTRSTIGLPPVIRANIQSLGLKKRNQIVYQTVTPSTAHKLARVKEIIKVDLVSRRKSPQELAKDRKFASGYELIRNGAVKPL